MEEGYITEQRFKGKSNDELADEIAKLFIGESLNVSLKILNLAMIRVLENDQNFKQTKDIEDLIAKMWEQNPGS